MATTYQLNDYAGSGTGYVKFSMDFHGHERLSVGDKFTVSGQYYQADISAGALDGEANYTLDDNGSNRYCIDYSGVKWIGDLEISLPKKTKKTFSFECEVSQALINASGAPAHTAVTAYFAVGSDANTYYASSIAAFPTLPLLTSRLAPEISNVTFTDSTGGKTHFGAFVQNASDITVSMNVTLDPLDSGLSIVSRVLTIGNKTYDLDSDTVYLGKLDFSTAQSWSLTVTDSAGYSTTVGSGNGYSTLPFLPYTAPTISANAALLVAERYKFVESETGVQVREASDDGESVWFSCVTNVCPVSDLNEWTLFVKFREAGTEEWTTRTLMAGSDGTPQTLTKYWTQNTEALTFAANLNWEFILWVEDFFNSTLEDSPLSGFADKAGGYFFVGKHGVAVGMRSTGTRTDERFEVKKEYTSHLYGGVETGVAERCILPNGDTTEGATTFHKGFANYSAGQAVKLHRTGNIVTLTGAAKRTSTLSSGSNANMFTVPEGYRPVWNVVQRMQGTSHNKWLLQIDAAESGGTGATQYEANVSRYGGTSNAEITTSNWLVMTAVWITNDPFPVGDLL